MIKLKNNPKQLLNIGFVGIRFKPDYDYWDKKTFEGRHKESVEWLLSLLDKDGYYAEHNGVIFVRDAGIESLVLLKYADRIEKIYKDKREWE